MTAVRVLHVDDEPDIREVVEVSLGVDPGFMTDEWIDAMRKAFLRRVKDDAATSNPPH
jgi:hypothetical protein